MSDIMRSVASLMLQNSRNGARALLSTRDTRPNTCRTGATGRRRTFREMLCHNQFACHRSRRFGLDIRFVMQGKEVSVDSFVEAIVRQVRSLVREEISRTLSREHNSSRESPQVPINEASRQAVSIREAARLLSISPRTIHNYIASRAIRTVRVGRRVLVPMKTVYEVANRGIPRRGNEKLTCDQAG